MHVRQAALLRVWASRARAGAEMGALKGKMRGRQAMGQAQYQGGRARDMIKRNPGRAGLAAGAVGGAALGSRGRKESADDEMFEDDDGNVWVMAGNVQEGFYEDEQDQEPGQDNVLNQIAESLTGLEQPADSHGSWTAG